jgi:hypothetical protein
MQARRFAIAVAAAATIRPAGNSGVIQALALSDRMTL